jgi:hypothetical protein
MNLAILAGTLDACGFAESELGFQPDHHQRRALESTADRVILNCTRQWGKSTVSAAKAVHLAYTKPDSLVLVASPSARQSAEFVRKASTFLRKLNIRPRGDGDNEISLALPNHSRIVGIPGIEHTIRGFSSVSLPLIDEASRVPDELYLALRPMLAVGGGSLWLLRPKTQVCPVRYPPAFALPGFHGGGVYWQRGVHLPRPGGRRSVFQGASSVTLGRMADARLNVGGTTLIWKRSHVDTRRCRSSE